MNFSLALGGGGAKGAAHIGVLKALAEYNLYPSSITGTSIGGIVAGLYGCGVDIPQFEELINRLSHTGKSLLDYNYTHLALGMIEAALGREITIPGLIKGDKIYRYLDTLTAERLLFQSTLPIAITSVDLHTGDTVIFHSHRQPFWNKGGIRYSNSGKISTAMRASSAVPGIFSPLSHHGALLADGGVTTMLPVDLSFAMGETAVIAVDLGASIDKPVRPYIIPIYARCLDIMSFPTIDPRNDGKLMIIKPQFAGKVSLLSFETMNFALEQGYEATMQLMPTIIKMLS